MQLHSSPLHVAIILDGNGRWATQKGYPRVMGHRAGAKTVRKIVEVAPDYGINMLTMYAFSADNWKRPDYEVKALMKLFGDYLRSETVRCLRNDVRLSVIGRRDRLAKSLIQQIEHAEHATREGQRLHLRIALDYSGRDMLVYAAQQLAEQQQEITRETLSHYLSGPGQAGEVARDVDLLIRTGGEQRLSDFQLWECAYAEFAFFDKMWPDFSGQDLQQAVYYFHHRERRFGGLIQPDNASFNGNNQVMSQSMAATAV